MTQPTIGFIGLGLMGAAMVGRLQDKGYALNVLGNRDRTGVEAALARGASEAATAKELAQASDIIMLCMGTSVQVEGRMRGDDGVIAGLSEGKVVVDFGTSLPSSTKALGDEVSAQGATLLDAPLGRTPSHAKDGLLNIMAAGDRATYDRIKPVLDDLGENVFHLGALGAGHTIKLINNFFAMTTACAMAEAFAMLGTEVVLVERAERLLPQEEAEASAIVEASLSARGVTVITGTGIEAVGRSPGGVELRLAGRTIEVDKVLLAVGRTPNTEGLGLDELGASFDADGHVETDDRLRTAIPGVYAVGDVTGKLPFTHAADEMGRIAAGNALKKGYRGRYRTHHTPWVTFTSPEVARVGVTEAEASAQGGRICELPMSEMDRAVTDGREDGFIKLITGPKRVTRHLAGGKVIGATIVAERAGEMIHEVAFAMRTRAFAGRLAQTVHAYPTWSYGLQKTAGQLFGEVEGRTWRPARA